MKRYVTLAAACCLQACLGSLYAWSAFVPALRDTRGLSTGQTQIVFGVMIAVFTLVMIPAGRLLRRFGPRPMALAGGLLYGMGYVVAGLAGGSMAGLIAGAGLLSGAGMGIAYICPVYACVKSFPENKGFATGLAVAGFGGGAVAVTAIVDPLLAGGSDVGSVFIGMGVAFAAITAVSAVFLLVPTETLDSPAAKAAVATEGRARKLVMLAGGMFAGTLAGLLVIGNIVPMGIAAGLEFQAAGMAVATFAVGNAAGRILWGRIHDCVGRPAIPVSLALLALSLGALLAAARAPMMFLPAAGAVGFMFGACFVLYAAEIARKFGAELVGTYYPVVFLAYGLSALIGPALGGFGYDLTGSYSGPVLAASVLALAGAAVTAHAPFPFPTPSRDGRRSAA